MDRLDVIFQMQRKLASVIDNPRYPTSPENRISGLCVAIIHECVELQRLTNWKWWKRPVEFDAVSAKEELVDIWHFVIQASLELGFTPSDLLEAYEKKNKVNHDRQKEGY